MSTPEHGADSATDPAVGGPGKAASPSAAPGGKLRPLIVVLIVAALVASAAAYWLGHRPAPISPPSVDLSGVDPAVVRAIERARDFVIKSPWSGGPWGRLGMVLLAHEFNAAANQCFDQAESLEPDNPHWPHYHGMSLAIELPAEAAAKFERAVALCPDRPLAPRLRLADTLLALGRVNAAENHFRRVLKIDPRNPYALLGLGRVAIGRAQPADAENHLRPLLDDSRTSKAAAALLAVVDEQLGNSALAEREARAARTLPNDPPMDDPFLDEARELRTGKYASFARADARLRGGHPAAAVALLRNTVRDYPHADDAWRRLGEALLAAEDPAGAENAFRDALRINPKYVELHNNLGLSLLRQDRYAEATAAFARAIELEPQHAESHFNRGLSLMRQEKLDAAAADFRTALRLRSELGSAHYQLGKVLALQGHAEAAIEELELAIQQEPANDKAQSLLRKLRTHSTGDR